MADHADDDLAPSQTEGFKVGEKKTLDEYKQLGELDLSHLCPLFEAFIGVNLAGQGQ